MLETFLKLLNVTQSMQDHSERKLTAQRGRDAPVSISEVFIGAPDQAFNSVRANWKSAIVMMISSGKSS